jgi:LCP family protein required for cell wall assembly
MHAIPEDTATPPLTNDAAAESASSVSEGHPTNGATLPPAPTVPVPVTRPAAPRQSHVASYQQYAQRTRRQNGLRRIALAMLTPLATCAAILLIYVIIPPPPVDILVLGVDARPGEGYVTRTDTIMLVGVQPRRMRLSLLSIPRDLFLDVPGYGSQRINTVNVLGELEEVGYGPELLQVSITNNFGVEPDKYARLNFDAFVQLVDAVGGLTIDVPKLIVDNAYPTEDLGTTVIRFEPGVQRMDGAAALVYARTRHTDDDYGRAERQQQVLSALARKLANPLNWGPAVTVIQRNVDTNMNVFEMALYAPPVVFGSRNIDRLVIDRDYILPGSQGAIPNYEKLAPWLDPRFD